MKSPQFLFKTFCFISLVFCVCLNNALSQQPTNSIIKERFIDPKLDYTAFSSRLTYPEIARSEGLEGKAIVRVSVDTNGKVMKYRYESSLGPLFEKAVNTALSLTTFTPAKHNGISISAEISVPVVFRLRGSPSGSFNYHEQNIHTLTAMQKLDPENRFQYLYWRGKEYYMNRDYDNAKADYDEYISSQPSNSQAYYEDDYLKFVADFLPKDTLNIDSILKKGQIFENYYLLDKAIEAYTFVIRKDSNDRRGLRNRAYTYLKCKEYDKSIIDYHKLISINPRDTLAYLNIGWNYYMLGKMNESIEYSEKAIQLNPDHYTALYNKALAHLRLNQIDNAKEIYKETISLQSKKGITPNRGAIDDLKSLVRKHILVEETMSILKEVFKISDEEIALLR